MRADFIDLFAHPFTGELSGEALAASQTEGGAFANLSGLLPVKNLIL